MRSWSIRWKLFAIPLVAVLLLAVGMTALIQSTQRYEWQARAAVASAIHPSGNTNARDADMLWAAEAAAAQALEQTRRAYLDDRIALVACLCAAMIALLGAAWWEANAVARRVAQLGALTPQTDRGTSGPLPPPDAEQTSGEFLAFARTLEGFGFFELDLVTGQVTGTPPFFAYAGLNNPESLFTRDEWFTTIHPEDLELLIAHLNQAISGSKTFEAEYRTVPIDGPSRTLVSRGRVMNDAEGYPARAIGLVSDVTDRKLAEQAALDIRCRLNGVIGLTRQLTETRLNSTQRECVEIIRGNVHGALSLLDDKLGPAKIEAGEVDLEAMEFDWREAV